MNNKDVCYKYCQARYYHDEITYISPGLEILLSWELLKPD